MIKNTLAVAFIFLLNTHVFAQGEANNWFFGGGAGLVFDNINGTVTPTAAASQTINTLEGCSSISDPNGNLKFYTDGRDVWDANHNIMPNANYFAGTGLLGDPSSTSSGVIIPKPGDLDKYYIFTVDEPHHQNAWAFPNQGPTDINGNPTSFYNDSFSSVPAGDDGFNNGLNYSLVDMTLNNGMGDIDSSEKNIQLQTYDPLIQEHLEYKCAEKITAVEHADGQSYWVLTHFVDTFYAFRIDSNGVNLAPVTSTVAPSISVSGYRRNGIGYLKSSPNGNILAISHSQNSNIEGSNSGNGSAWLYDFDKETGLVSNPLQVDSNDNFYGVAFSQNSEKVYFSSSNGVQQFDLTSADIPSSATSIYQTSSGFMGAMQLGPDGKIYICNPIFDFTLDVINAPNETGTSVNYVEAGQQLSPGTSASYGLPPFIQSFLVANISYVNDCLGSSTEFYLSTSETIVSLEWDFGDSVTSTDLNPTHVYNLPGEYTVSVTITTTTEVQTFDTLVTIFDTPTANAVNDINVCDDDNDGVSSFDFNTEVTPDVLDSQDAASFSVSYHASQQDADDNQNPFSNPYINTLTQETVFVRIENVDNTDCFDTTSFDIEVFDTPVIAAINDLQNCDDGADGDLTNEQMDTDLSQLNSVVLGTQDTTLFSVSYHLSSEDATTGTNGLPLTYYNTTASEQTLFVRIENVTNTDCFATQDFKLIINTTPTANAVNDINVCDDDNDGVSSFDFNTEVTPDVLDSQDAASFSVSYHASQQDADDNQNPFSNPYINTLTQETVFVRIENVDNTDCFDTTSFDIEVFDTPVIAAINDLQNCDDGADGDLTNEQMDTDLSQLNSVVLGTQDTTLFSVSYHLSSEDATTGTNGLPLTYYNTTASEQTLFVRIENVTNTDCFATQDFKLIINTTPTANAVNDINVCDDDNDGVSSFDFNTEVTPDVLDSQDAASFSVSYHASQQDADDNQNPFSNPYINTLTQETVFVRIENVDNTDCFDTTSFDIEVFDTPVIAAINDLQNCDDGADGDLTNEQMDTDLSQLNSVVLGTQDTTLFSVSYHLSSEDATTGTNGLPLTYYNTTASEQTLFVRIENVTNTDCFATQDFKLIINTTPTANAVNDINVCDDDNDGVSSFDFNTEVTPDVLDSQDAASFSVSYHASQQDADDNQNPFSNPYINTLTQETVFVRIENVDNTDCFDTTSFDIEVFDTPVIAAINDLQNCDDGADGDLTNEQMDTDLSQLNSVVLGTQDTTLFSVSYHLSSEDATTGTNGLPLTYYNTTASEQTLFVRIENVTNTDCFATQDFKLIINTTPTANAVNDINVCDDDNDGVSSFDFNTEVTPDVLDSQDAASFSVSYHASQQDADDNQNPFSNPYINTLTQETVFVRIENVDNTDCFDTTSFDIEVFDTPVLPVDFEYYQCDYSNPGDLEEEFDLTALNGSIANGQDVTITHYESELDAENGTNPITNLYTNTSTSQTLYVQMVSNIFPECKAVGPYTIGVDPLPNVVVNVPLVQCDIDNVQDGISIYNLEEAAENLVVGDDPTNYALTFHLSQTDLDAGINAIADPTSYVNLSPLQTIFVRVENIATTCYTTSFFYLETIFNPIPDDAGLIVCDNSEMNGNDYDGLGLFTLSDANNYILSLIVDNPNNDITDPNQLTIAYYTSEIDALLELNQLPNQYISEVPDTQTLFIRVERGNDCFGINSIQLQVLPVPEYNEVDDEILCTYTPGSIAIDLSDYDAAVLGSQDASEVIITYHTTQEDADTGVNALVSPYTVFDQITLFVREEVQNNDPSVTACFISNVNFTLTVEPRPEFGVPIPLIVCDDDGVLDGLTTLDISVQTELIAAGIEDNIVSYHLSQEDANSGNNPLDTIYTTVVPDLQTIFVRIVNDLTAITGCYSTTPFDLVVVSPPNAITPNDFEYCDEDADGYGLFDLTELDAEITGTLSNLIISYHETEAEALNNVNAIVGDYSNIVPYQQTIYVRIEDTTITTPCYRYLEFQLIVNDVPQIELNPEPLEVCDDDTDGFAVFNLSLSDTEILNGLDPLEFEITYYETFVDAELKQNELLTPLNFTNTTPTTQTIFVRVENLTTECFKAIALPLIVNPLPVIIQPVPLELCDDAAADQITIFDLTDKNLEITNSDGSLEVVYYTTLLDAENATNAIADPTTYTNTAIGTAAANPQTLHVRVTDLDTGCYDLTTLTIRVLPNPTPNMNPDNLIACDDTNSGDGIEVFDLTTYETLIVNGEGNVSPTYHQSLEDALDGLNAIPNPTNYSNTETPLQTIYVRVTNDLTACFTVLDFDLIVNPIPNAIAIDDFIACELNTDDVYDFDLESQSSLILGGQDPALFEVTYHTNLADADSGINFLGSPYTNISDPQTIYISVENINTGCRNTTVQFNLAVHEAALASSPLAAYTVCDDNVETDGNPTNDRVQFDLSTQNNFVLNGQDPVDYTVRYYASQSDADQAINELPTLFENSVNPQLIIARVDNDTQVLDSSGTLIDSSICYETAEVTLEVNPLPVVEIEDDYLLCVDLNGTEVLSPLVIDTGLSNTEHTFIWRDASGMLVATNSNYAPVQGGTYTLEVFDDTLSTQCAAPIETFTVIESTPPIVTAQVTTAAFANTHVIEAVATGQGQYEYSLDQGPWGDSGTFIDVTPGEHLVTVRDINGCGESEAFVYVIDYPKYFTPNGDGYHDSWNINAVSNQVNAKIYIFDRLGKLIKEIRPSGTGWDGTYNGTLLPSSDYWFTLNYIDPTTANPEVLRAHFSLKR